MHSNNVTSFFKQDIIVHKIKYLINMARTYLVAALLEALRDRQGNQSYARDE